MNFLTLAFLIYISTLLIIYYLVAKIKVNRKYIIPQWWILLVGSIIFFGFANPISLIYITVSSLIAYLIGLYIDSNLYNKYSEEYKDYFNKKNKIAIGIGIAVLVLVLAVLKYFNFFSISLLSLFGIEFDGIKFLVPLGISFYTFTLIAYMVDCSKGKYKPETNIFKFMLFATYFPKVLQGPITNIEKVTGGGLYNPHTLDDVEFYSAFKRISVGVCKKVVIADTIGIFVNYIWNNYSEINGFILILGAFLYSIQLYCDFSGYIDMGLGISNLFGIKLEENFDAPYLSKDVGEFWRRWHITLGAWLREYIYIPLGGNRCPTWKWMINILVVWLVSGLWHGANWTFVVWGLYFGVLILLSGLIRKLLKKKNKQIKHTKSLDVFSICITFLLVTFGWVFFRAPTLMDAFNYIKYSFVNMKIAGLDVFSKAGISWIYFLVSLIALAMLIGSYIYKMNKDKVYTIVNNQKALVLSENIVTYICCTAFLAFAVILIIYYGGLGIGTSSFIYFEF